MLKYDVFDDYGKAGSQCRSTGMTRRGRWHDKKRRRWHDALGWLCVMLLHIIINNCLKFSKDVIAL
ncbi:MAG: hypothetical protein LBU02_00215 [Rickettsiales bacterium]|nr:hypothetical protein [Rickettsiales bacterium]